MHSATLDWPKAERFPLNIDRHTAFTTLWPDLRESASPLIITGYAGLDQIIDFISECDAKQRPRVLLGFEPFAGQRSHYRLQGQAFSEEMTAYWLEQGISLRNSARLLLCRQRLQAGQVECCYIGGQQRLHAKLFVGEQAVTLGSSNFTEAGLRRNLEANVRFSRQREGKRYREAVQVAENYWRMGADYTRELIELLDKLLQVVGWQEALARACAELLEGEWAGRFIRDAHLDADTKLWPSQKQGIAQALFILSKQDSVLIADATGSGKTRMGVHLIDAVTNQIVRSGRYKYGGALMVCPPSVECSWRDEAVSNNTDLNVYSHGVLSHSSSRNHEVMMKALRRAQILCVDEGHNFLNIKSNRTRELLRNMADHVMLFTATPINRSVTDLLRIVDMLGADNLEPDTLDMFQKLLGRQSLNHALSETEFEQLRNEIRRFTVRRTKSMLNAMIEREPRAYTDHRGKPCRFPRHKARIYRLDEPEADRKLAGQIRELAEQLTGIAYFQKTMEMPAVLRSQGRSEEQYLQGRLRAAKRLARYMIMACLRSSRLALVEHIAGTEAAVRHFELTGFSKASASGNVLDTLKTIAGKLPGVKLKVSVPDWLADAGAHRKQCENEYRLYEEIFRLTCRLSDHREARKAQHLLTLLKRHKLLLAFDRSPITLAEIRRQIGRLDANVQTLIATGDRQSQRERFLRAFAPGSEESCVIGLCSDSFSEGVNLQQASAMVHLDMPSVVRIAEQRVGRVDRMDSPHRQIEAWWPEDAPEFALSSDDKFIERYETVDNLLGSNMPLPESMQADNIGQSRALSTRKLIEEFEREAQRHSWDGISDAFENVRALVFGEQALVPADVYDSYRDLKVKVLSRVSVVRARRSWAFFCLSAGMLESPRWVLFDGFEAAPLTDLDAVVAALRERLGADTENLPLDDRVGPVLDRFMQALARMERSLLSRKKQRALEELDHVLKAYLHQAGEQGEQAAIEHYLALQRMLQTGSDGGQPDWDEVAARWLDVIRPVWYEALRQPRARPLLLKDIRQQLIDNRARIEPALLENFAAFPVQKPIDKRVRACIVGMA